jgi:hypothetical protein
VIGSFGVAITVLERNLYEIYAASAAIATAPLLTATPVSSPAVESSSTVSSTPRSNASTAANMILRDLLLSSELRDALPPNCVSWLRVLFSPKGLNLRNIVWHGFIAPHQFPPEFASLTLMLTLSLPPSIVPNHGFLFYFEQ